MAKYLYLDTETGGLDPATDALLTIGLVAHDDAFGVIGKEHIEVQPEGMNVHPKALEINHIDMDVHTKVAFSRHEAANRVVAFVHKHFGRFWKNAPIMIGHNVKFDVGFMDELWKTTGVKKPYSYHNMCTMGIAVFIKELGLLHSENVKLATLVDIYGIENDDAHNSLSDALATRELHLALRDTVLGVRV